MDYSKAFRVVRAAFGLSQIELSDLLEIGPSHISLIESGKRQPSHKVIRRLAQTLRVPPSLLTLLASEPRDLETQDGDLSGVALALLKILVHASGEELKSKQSRQDGNDLEE